MKTFEINGSLRTEKGKKFTTKMRKQDTIPAIMYGGKENVMLTLNESDLRNLINTPYVYIVDLKVGKKSYKSIIKDGPPPRRDVRPARRADGVPRLRAARARSVSLQCCQRIRPFHC